MVLMGIRKKYDYIFEMDADFPHNPNDLEKLYNACHFGNADLALVPLRYRGKCCQLAVEPCFVILLLQLRSTGMKIHDATAGFICYKRRCLRTLINKIKFVGYAFQIEMKYRTFVKILHCRSANYFTDRTKGNLK
jgi:dolichol-phosphate mannosyltransferase